MKTTLLFTTAVTMLWAAALPASAELTAGNVRAAQRPNTKLVDIDYDVSGVTTPVIVALEISSDGGTTWSVPATTLTGAVGNSVTPGNNLRVTWDAGTDWNGQVSTQTKFRISVTAVPSGFSQIPAGIFTMGNAMAADTDITDAPTHTVNVSAFYMAQNLVTKTEWDTVRLWAISNGYSDLAAGAGKTSNHPVQTVSWWDGVIYCNARSQKEGLTPVYTVSGAVMQTGTTAPVVNWAANGYRLPTEAEWEKAARGGLSGKRFPWGDTITHSQSNYNSIASYAYDVSPTRGYHPTYATGSQPYTSPTGSFAPNGYGLYDMAGNVLQWCWDWYGTYDTSTPTDPRGVSSGSNRVVRGGSWYCYWAIRRTADRNHNTQIYTYNDLGVRVSRSLTPENTFTTLSSTTSLDTRDYVTLTLSTPSHGNITDAGSYLPGSTATITAVPDPGYVFTAWTGDASGTENPLSLTMDADKTVGATFSPDLADSDSDGLSNFDEAVTYGTNPAVADSDGDGLSDAHEVGRGRFSVVMKSLTWAQAKADAATQGGYLATFATEKEWNLAMQEVGADALLDLGGLWIGASDQTTEGTWTWVTGEPFAFAPWATSQPDNSNDSDFAAVAGELGGESGKWYDFRATTLRDGYLLETGYTTNPSVADADGDGLNDGAEQQAGSSPFLSDTDGDGLTDTQEVQLTQTNPTKADSDNDGTNDAADDQDGDGLSNLAEISQYGTDPLKADTDGDGLADNVELAYAGSVFQIVSGNFTHTQAVADAASKRGRLAVFANGDDFSRLALRARQSVTGDLWLGLSDAATEGTWLWDTGVAPTYTRWVNSQPDGNTSENHAVLAAGTSQWADANENFVAAGYLFERPGLDPLNPDSDADGLSDGAEVTTYQTNPQWDDSDGDGLTDGAEVNTHHSNPNADDTDGDGLSDRVEVEVHHSNPSLADSDGDGFDDLFEVNTGFNPASAESTPDAVSSIRTAVEFRFNAAKDVRYRIEQSTDLQNWTVLEEKIVGTGGGEVRFYSTENQPKRYFRVRRE